MTLNATGLCLDRVYSNVDAVLFCCHGVSLSFCADTFYFRVALIRLLGRCSGQQLNLANLGSCGSNGNASGARPSNSQNHTRIEAARVISYEEQQKLLEPWFGPAAPLQRLSLPTLIDITEAASGYNVENLRLRLAADVPGAILDDHARWRRPLVQAANTLWAIGLFCALLILSASGAMITLAARASMSANSQVIAVLRMIGAHDSYVAAAFVQRFTFRTLIGSLIGCALAALLLITFTVPTQEAAILTRLGLEGRDWLRLIVIPVLFTVLALLATYAAAHRVLKGLS